MKIRLKIIFITLIALVSIIILDTIQAVAFNNKPFFKIVEYHDGGFIHQKHKGILVNTYIYNDGSQKTFFKWTTKLYKKEQ